MVSSEPTWHVSRVQKRVSKFVNFKVQKVQKPELFDFTDTCPWLRDVMLSFCHTPHLWAIFLSNIMLLGTCERVFGIQCTSKRAFCEWKENDKDKWPSCYRFNNRALSSECSINLLGLNVMIVGSLGRTRNLICSPSELSGSTRMGWWGMQLRGLQ